MAKVSLSEKIIRDLYKITSNYHQGFENQINDLITMGLERFNLDIGILAKIEGNTYRVMHCVVPEGVTMQPDDEFDLGVTYCNVTCMHDKPFFVEHAKKHDTLAAHPAYKEFALESYIGVPIKIDGKLYVTYTRYDKTYG